jgi:hypothetical protein
VVVVEAESECLMVDIAVSYCIFERLARGQSAHPHRSIFLAVRSFGTEGREKDDTNTAKQFIPASDHVYPHITFRGADIKVDSPRCTRTLSFFSTVASGVLFGWTC